MTSTFDALEDVDHPVPPELEARLPELVELLYEDSPSVAQGRSAAGTIPHECHLLNLYATALSATGQEQRSMEVRERNYRLHPTYLFARLNYAELLIVTGRIEEVRGVFGGQLDLKHMYPHRNVFHYTEVIGLFSVTGRYFIVLGGPGNGRGGASTCSSSSTRITTPPRPCPVRSQPPW